MRRAGRVVCEVLELVRSKVKPGATTLDLENAAQARLNELGVKAAFKGYHGYPCVLCASVNSEVVHGIPSAKRVLKEGDIVSLDLGRWWTATSGTQPSRCRWARRLTQAPRGC